MVFCVGVRVRVHERVRVRVRVFFFLRSFSVKKVGARPSIEDVYLQLVLIFQRIYSLAHFAAVTLSMGK